MQRLLGPVQLVLGDFAVIGEDVNEAAGFELPLTASCGQDKRVIRIPRKTLLAVSADTANLIGSGRLNGCTAWTAQFQAHSGSLGLFLGGTDWDNN